MIRFERFFFETQLRNFSYLICDDQTANAWVIDPYDASPFTKYIKKEGLSLKGILNTHQHFDHVRGNEELIRTFQAPLVHLTGGKRLVIDERNAIEVLDTPGHTSDHQVFLWHSNESPATLFSGDTLFNAGVGNCKNGGNVDELYQSVMELQRILPLDTVLQPGHDYLKRNLEFSLHIDPGNRIAQEKLKELIENPLKRKAHNLADELEINPFFHLQNPELIEKYQSSGKSLFIKLRSLRDNW